MSAHTPGQIKINTPAYKINAEHAALMDACGLPSYEQLVNINADLVAALQAITSMCEGYQGHPIGNDQRTKDARAALAKAGV